MKLENVPTSRKDIVEVIAAILLATVSVATAWSGYQATLWSGIQASSYTKASGARVEASKLYTEAGALRNIDINVFMQWLNSYAANDKPDLTEFYRARFRDEFAPAFEAWLASDPKDNPAALPTPFRSPLYNLKTEETSAHLTEQAETFFTQGADANRNADNYVLNTVMLAMVLFFGGISQSFSNRRVRITLLVSAGVILILSLTNLLTLPVAMN